MARHPGYTLLQAAVVAALQTALMDAMKAGLAAVWKVDMLPGGIPATAASRGDNKLASLAEPLDKVTTLRIAGPVAAAVVVITAAPPEAIITEAWLVPAVQAISAA